MLSFHVNGNPLELPDDFSLTMNLKSPIFNEIGSYSYPFKIPNTPRNAIRMGFRHRVPCTGDPYRVDKGAFLWKGHSLFSGNVKMKVFNSSTFEGNIFEGNGDFNYSMKNSSLQDVDFGEMIFASENLKMDYINNCKNKFFPERVIAFPQILNKSYFEELPTDTSLYYFNYYYTYGIDKLTPYNNRTVIVPMLYLRYVLKKIFEYLHFSFDDSFFSSDPDYNSLLLFNSVDCNTGPTGYFSYDELRLLLNYHVPRASINGFLSGLETFFNIRFFVNNNTRTVKLISIDKIIKSNEYHEFSKNISSIGTELQEQITGYQLSMNMDTDDEYFSVVKDEQETFLKHLKDPVGSRSDLNPWPASEENDIRFVRDENSFYTVHNKAWITTNFINDVLAGYSELIYKDKSQSIESKFSTLMHEFDPPYNCAVGCAQTGWNDEILKIFFAHYQDGPRQNMVGRHFTANNNLFYYRESGLFNKHYRTYLDFRIKTKLVKIVKQMDFNELNGFDFSLKYMINGIKYLVGSIQVTIKKDRIMPATLECYPCT